MNCVNPQLFKSLCDPPDIIQGIPPLRLLHIHPYNDDVWYIIQGVGEYFTTVQDKETVKSGDIAVASQGDVHGIFNPGPEDIIVYSVLSPLPIEIQEAPGFEYPE